MPVITERWLFQNLFGKLYAKYRISGYIESKLILIYAHVMWNINLVNELW